LISLNDFTASTLDVLRNPFGNFGNRRIRIILACAAPTPTIPAGTFCTGAGAETTPSTDV
jgi:hypothetical protein